MKITSTRRFGLLTILAVVFAGPMTVGEAQSTSSGNKQICADHITSGKVLVENDVWDIYRALQAAPKKDDYETTKAFESRQQRWVLEFEKTYLVDHYGAPELFIDVGKLKTQFNADKGLLKIGSGSADEPSSILETPEEFDSKDRRSFKIAYLSHKETVIGGYSGSNAFGVTRKVSRVDATELGVALARADGTHLWPTPPPRKYPITDGKADVRMSPEEAKSLQNDVHLLVAGRISVPFSFISFSEHKPTITEPTEVITDTNIIVMRPICALIYGKTAHKVLKEILLR